MANYKFMLTFFYFYEEEESKPGWAVREYEMFILNGARNRSNLCHVLKAHKKRLSLDHWTVLVGFMMLSSLCLTSTKYDIKYVQKRGHSFQINLIIFCRHGLVFNQEANHKCVPRQEFKGEEKYEHETLFFLLLNFDINFCFLK